MKAGAGMGSIMAKRMITTEFTKEDEKIEIYWAGEGKKQSEDLYRSCKTEGGVFGPCAFIRSAGAWKDYSCWDYCK